MLFLIPNVPGSSLGSETAYSDDLLAVLFVVCWVVT